MPPSVFKISREHALQKLDYRLAKSIVAVTFSSIIIYGDYVAKIWSYAQRKNDYGNELITSCIWLCLLCTLTALVDLPFDLYHVFILERSLGLNIVTLKEFLKDHIIGFLVVQVLTMNMAAAIVVITQYYGRYVFILLWFCCCVVLSFFSHVAPMIQSPPSGEIVEFPQGDLNQKIHTLSKEIGFPLNRIGILMQRAQREENHCLYYYGLFSKTIIISVDIIPVPEVLISLTDDEILALLAHEFGHWFQNHTIKKFLFIQVVLVMWFYAFSYICDKKVLYEAFGFYESQPILVGIMVSIQYVMMPYNVLIAYALISLSRRFEFEADNFAAHLGMGEALKKALLGINEVSFQFPVFDELYSQHNFNQPSLLDRIRNLNNKII